MTLGRPGDLLADRYRLDRFVGGGGSVERWRAYDERLARPVTARLEPAAAGAEERDEKGNPAAAQAALTSVAQLNHPGVAAVYDVGTADGLRGGAAVGYAISEWTEGRTLGQIMATGPQPWPRTADWGRQISGALAALHEIGIAHGALSPQSVAIHDDRQVKILDVGLDSEAGQDAGPREPAGTDGGGAVRTGETQGFDIEAEAHGGAELPPGAPDDVYALGFLLWEATVGAAPEYVLPAVSAGEETEAAAQTAAREGTGKAGRGEAEAATRVLSAAGTSSKSDENVGAGVDGDADGESEGEAQQERASARAAAASVGATGGIDQGPLLATGAPVEFAALLTRMLSGDPASRPTAAEAEKRFAPFAHADRVSDTLPGIAAAANARTQVIGPPITSGAAAAEAAEAERERRRGALPGLVILVAVLLAGLGFWLVNLNSHSGGPSVVNTVIPSSSPGMVTLPNGSLSPAPSQAPTTPGQATTFAPSTPASTAATSQPSTSPSASASPSSAPSTKPAPSSSGTAAGTSASPTVTTSSSSAAGNGTPPPAGGSG